MSRVTRPYSFQREHRLEGPNGFSEVFAYRCSANGALFQAYAKPNGRQHARLGIVVSKRIMPRAVDRNFCKRISREAFRLQRLNVPGIDIVVRPRVRLLRAQGPAARQEIRVLLQRAYLQCQTRASAGAPH